MAKKNQNKPQRNAAQRKKDRRRERHDIRDYERLVLRYGPHAAAAEAHMKSKQWQRTKKAARRQGYSLDSFLDPNVPRPLKERTRPALRKQAMRTVRKAYKPVITGLNQQESRVQALDEKRRIDDEHYRKWLTDQMSLLEDDNSRVESALIGHAQKIRDEQEAQLDEQQTGLYDEGGDNAAGIGSERRDSISLDFSDETKHALTQLDNQRLSLDEAIGRGRDRSAAAAANTLALGAANEAKRVADTWTALMDIADEKEKVKLQRAADSATEVSRLLDKEVEKSQMNREFSAALQKLNLDRAEMRQDAKQFAESLAQERLSDWRSYKLGKLRLNESKRATNLLDAYRSEQIQLGRDRLEMDWWKSKHPQSSGGSKGPGTEKERRRQVNQNNFSEAYAQLSTAELPVKRKGEVKAVPVNAKRARANRSWVINALVAAGYSRQMADAVWRAYVANNGNDYGNWKRYLHDKNETSHASP